MLLGFTIDAPGLDRLHAIAQHPETALAPAHEAIAGYLVDVVLRHIDVSAGVEGGFAPLAPLTQVLRGSLPMTPLVESGDYRRSISGHATGSGAEAGSPEPQAAMLEEGGHLQASSIPVDISFVRPRISGRPKARTLRIGPVDIPARPHYGLTDEEMWESVDRFYFPALLPGDQP